MPAAKNTSVETTRGPMAGIAAPDNRAEPEGSMSYAMITIGSGVGHLAAGIFSALAHGLRFLSAPARASERRSRTSDPRLRLTGSRWESFGV